MATEATKKLIERYLTLTIWYLVHQDDKDISTDKLEVVLGEIGKVDYQLRKHGVSNNAILKLIDYAEQIYKTPVEQLSKSVQLRISKIIFGEGPYDK